MSDYVHAINQIYGQAELSAKLLTALREAGKDLDALTRDDLAVFDEQHGGGREATRELARLTGLHAGMHVLDVGSGLGGPARTLAAEFDCRVRPRSRRRPLSATQHHSTTLLVGISRHCNET